MLAGLTQMENIGRQVENGFYLKPIKLYLWQESCIDSCMLGESLHTLHTVYTTSTELCVHIPCVHNSNVYVFCLHFFVLI